MKTALAAGLLALSLSAAAHDAPSGWKYPAYCCGVEGRFCRQIACSDIVQMYPGDPLNMRYRYAPDHVHFWPNELRPSGDAHCHVCFSSSGTPEKPHYGGCLFMPQVHASRGDR